MEGAQTAPVDAAESCHLAGTVYSGRILPLPAERHLRQQRDHLQRPAQIAEIMHLPPRPGLSESAAIRTVMHAVGLRGGNFCLQNDTNYHGLRVSDSEYVAKIR